MAYSKTPVVQTYETKRVNFISNPQQRSGDANKDFRLVNMMTEVLKSPVGDQSKYYIKSRPGMSAGSTAVAGEGRGIYYWALHSAVFWVTGNKLYYSNGTSAGTLMQTIDSSTNKVGFTEFVYSTGDVALILSDQVSVWVITYNTFSGAFSITKAGDASLTAWAGTTAFALNDIRRPTTANGYGYKVTVAGTSSGTQPTWPTTVGATVNDGTVTWTCIDPNPPSPHSPTPIYLDGYLFLAKEGTQDIYNSNLDNPKQWTAGDFISAEMYPDRIVSLSKNNNYLYAIGSGSVEYFYDAANATGSPLARHNSAVQQFGTAALGSVVQTEKEVIFIGETQDGGHTVWTIDGFKEKEIGVPAIKSALLAEDGSVVNARAFSLRLSGQKLYIICLSTRTLVYSFDTQMWSEWSSGTGAFRGYYGCDGPNGSAYILDKSTGQIYLMDENKFTDAGTAFTCTVISAKLDFDSINRKFMHRLSIIGDVPDDTLVDSAVNVSWSDDDYKTWSTPRTLIFNADLPAIHQLGQFRRRALKLSYSLPHLFRIETVEVDINKGSV